MVIGNGISKNILEQTKNLYDKAYKSRSFMIKKSEALPELVVDGFDTEQIWQQIELANKDVFDEINNEMIANYINDEIVANYINEQDDKSDDEPCCSNELFDYKKEDENKEKNKSSFEDRQGKLNKNIERWEQEAVSEKPWQLKGEVTAHTRPKNSLLEEYLEFDSALRPAPIMTGKVTEKLEDVITKRIKDCAWDDVFKKFKPMETPFMYKKRLVMNQEKSKESLAQIYEKEYLLQKKTFITGDQNAEEKEVPPEQTEIRQRINLVFSKLDALSNFNYTPKLAKPEIKIISNELATNMEEVGPMVISEATTLAPEEILGKPKGNLLGKSERNKTDKKRERRKKKVKQHHRALYQNKKEKKRDIYVA